MRQLDPAFDLFAAAGPTVSRHMRQQFSVKDLKGRFQGLATGLYGAASELPTLIHLMLVRLKQAVSRWRSSSRAWTS